MVIALSTLFTDTWNTVYTLINNNITDPETRGTKWIYSSFPFKRISDSTAYPLVVIESPEATSSRSTIGSNYIKEFDIPITFEIYALKAIQIDSIVSDIHNIISTNGSSLSGNGIHGTSIQSTDNLSATEKSGKIVHVKSITFSFETDFEV